MDEHDHSYEEEGILFAPCIGASYDCLDLGLWFILAYHQTQDCVLRLITEQGKDWSDSSRCICGHRFATKSGVHHGSPPVESMAAARFDHPSRQNWM